MAGKQAKILSDAHISSLRRYCHQTRYPLRNLAMVLLSTKAGLRAGEIAKLTWEMVLTPSGAIGHTIELQDRIAKKRSGRSVPIHPELRTVLNKLKRIHPNTGQIIRSERGERMRDLSVVIWFATTYRKLGLYGCSSHSGRRTFITKAAKLVYRAGGSLRDVQILAGHRSIQTTQRYIDGDSDAQRKLVSLI